MRWVASIGFAFVACGRPTSSMRSVHNDHAQQPTERSAQAEYIETLRLDYRNPMHRRARGRASSVDTDHFGIECLAGERAACIRSTSRLQESDRVRKQIEANCQAGHMLSCRYMNYVESGHVDPSLSASELRRGCTAGLVAECDVLSQSHDERDIRFGTELRCLYAQLDCKHAARSNIDGVPRDPSRAQYLLELGCQSVIFSDCLELVGAYRRHEIEEPYRGRADEVLRFMCHAWPYLECVNDDLPYLHN